jgi:ribose-phosphate pyrophosphokinase
MIKITLYNSFNTPYDLGYDKLTFKGGEIQVKLHEVPAFFVVCSDLVLFTAHMTSASDIVELALLKNALEIEYPLERVELQLAYLPYARQDRVCADREA